MLESLELWVLVERVDIEEQELQGRCICLHANGIIAFSLGLSCAAPDLEHGREDGGRVTKELAVNVEKHAVIRYEAKIALSFGECCRDLGSIHEGESKS